jgi:hypothetical protein
MDNWALDAARYPLYVPDLQLDCGHAFSVAGCNIRVKQKRERTTKSCIRIIAFIPEW